MINIIYGRLGIGLKVPLSLQYCVPQEPDEIFKVDQIHTITWLFTSEDDCLHNFIRESTSPPYPNRTFLSSVLWDPKGSLEKLILETITTQQR